MAFYDGNTRIFLNNRIGWAAPIPPTDLVISEENLLATSGRHFNRFNELVTVENVYATVNNASINTQTFNDYLVSLTEETVLSVLATVFDNEERAYYRYCYNGRRMDISGIDYSPVIQSKTRLFDNLIGLRMAISCLELFLTSDRVNGTNKNIKFDVSMLKQELEGVWSDDRSKLLTKGLYTKYSIELEKVKNILFPVERKNTVRGVSVW